MFKVSALVQHKITGTVGRVLGYGCRVSGHIYFMTLKVKPLKRQYFSAYIEDTMDEWRSVPLDDSQLLRSRVKRLNLIA